MVTVSFESNVKDFDKIVSPEDFSCFEQFGYDVERILSKMFELWAKKVVCRFPILTIVISFAWTIPLIFGLQTIEFTTDPIRLWSSESSRSYQEYRKYNSYFGPFYRTSQVIATLKPEFGDLPPIIHKDPYGKEFEFDQVLNKDYWPELMQVQDEVADASMNYTFDGKTERVHFEDVCLNPLSVGFKRYLAVNRSYHKMFLIIFES